MVPHERRRRGGGATSNPTTQGEPKDPRPVRAGDDLEAKALQRALLASVGVKFHGEAVDEEDWAE